MRLLKKTVDQLDNFSSQPSCNQKAGSSSTATNQPDPILNTLKDILGKFETFQKQAETDRVRVDQLLSQLGNELPSTVKRNKTPKRGNKKDSQTDNVISKMNE